MDEKAGATATELQSYGSPRLARDPCYTVGECPAPLRAGLLGLRVVSPPIPRASTLQGSHLNLSDLDQRAAQAQRAKGGNSFFQASLRLFLKSVLLSIACRRYFLLNNKFEYFLLVWNARVAPACSLEGAAGVSRLGSYKDVRYKKQGASRAQKLHRKQPRVTQSREETHVRQRVTRDTSKVPRGHHRE